MLLFVKIKLIPFQQLQPLGYNALIWTTTGAGVITNGNSLTPTYTPAAADITIGQITLSLEASAIAPCVSSDFSSMTLFFENQPYS